MIQWLGSVVFYGVYQIGDLLALKWFRPFLFFAVFGTFTFYARKRIPFFWLCVLIFIASFGFSSRAWLRPDTLNLLFVQAYLILFFRQMRQPRTKTVLFIPLLSVIWSNMHLGCFIFGTAIIGLFGLHHLVELIKRRSWREPVALKHLGLVVAGHFGALFVNPYGLEGGLYPFKAVFSRDFIVRKTLLGTIQELQPPVFLLSFEGWWFYLLAGTAVWVLLKDKKDNLPCVLLFLWALMMFLYAKRAAGLFVLAALYVIVEKNRGLPGLMNESRNRKTLFRRGVNLVFALVLIFNISRLLNLTACFSDRCVNAQSLLVSAYHPSDIIRRLQKKGIEGRVFSPGHYGNVLLWSAYPRLRPLVDTRQADPERYLDYLAVLREPQKHWRSVEEKYGLTIALLDANMPLNFKIAGYLAADPRWRLVAVDGPAALFLKETPKTSWSYDLAAFEERLGKMSVDIRRIKSELSAHKAPARRPFLFSLIFPPPYYVESLEEGVVLFTMGFEAAGIDRMVSALKQTGHPKAERILKFALREWRREPFQDK